jgi:hypothetical protein
MRRAVAIIVAIAGIGLVVSAQAQSPPAPPAGVTAADRPADQGYVIVVTITASPDDGAGTDSVTLYRVQRRPAGGAFAFLRNVPATDAAQYVITDRVDVKNTRYEYQVEAYDGAQYSTPVTAGAEGGDETKPRPPRNLKVLDVPGDQGKALQIQFAASPDDGAGADDVRRYRISRKTPDGKFVKIAVVVANGSASYSRTEYGLTPNTSYTYRVVAWDGRNTSTPASATGKTVDNRPPRPPTGLKVTDRPNDNGDALILTFSKSPDDGAKANDVKQYHIFRNPGPGGVKTLTLVGKVPATGAASYQHTDKGLTPGQKYNYVVKAFDGTNLSKGASGSGTPIDNRGPRPARNVKVVDVPNDNGDAVTVSFGGSPDDGAGANDVVSYEILRKRAGGVYAFLRNVAATDSQLYSFTDAGLLTGKEYVYRVRAFDGAQYSTPVFGRGTPLDNTPPRPPTDFAVAAAPDALGAADITFTASVDDTAAHPEVTAYEIFQKRAGTAWPVTATLTVTAKKLATYSARDTGLTVGATYVYKARAKAATGYSKWTSEKKIVAKDTRKPAPPRGLTAQDRPDDDGNAVIVTWNRSLDDGSGRNIVAKYAVYRKLTSVFESPATKVKTVDATGASTYQILDTSSELLNLRSYTYWATAVSGAGVESDPSNEAEAVPRDDIILEPPTNLGAADHPGNGNAIDLAWTRSTSEGGIGPPPPPPFGMQGGDTGAAASGDYEVFRRRVGQSWPTTVYMTVSASVAGNPIQVTDAAAPNGVAFEYKVRYRVGTAISPFSNTATATAKDGAASLAAAGLTVTITEAPATVLAGQPIAVKVAVSGEGLSTVALQWRVNDGAWQKSATKTGSDTYEVSFTLTPGGVVVGDVVSLVATAANAKEQVASEEVQVGITQ